MLLPDVVKYADRERQHRWGQSTQEVQPLQTAGKQTLTEGMSAGDHGTEDPKTDGQLPRLDLKSNTAFDDNTAKLRASIDAELAREQVAVKLGAKLRPLVQEALETPKDGRKPIAVRVATPETEYFKSQPLTGGDKHDSDHGFGSMLGDVLEGLLGGLVAAGLDYLRFNRSMQAGNVPEYRPEQVGTQVEVGATVDAIGGTGAALAFAAFQWCFTNDLLYYAYAYADDSKAPGWNDTRAGVKQLARNNGPITWSSWSLLGLVTGTGNETHPMTFAQAMFQGAVLGPLLALALAAAAESLDLQNLIGSMLSLSLDTQLDKEVDEASLVQALAIRLKLSPDQAAVFVAKVSPLIVSGNVEGTRASGQLQLTDELVTACIGVGISFRGVGKDKDGKTIGHGALFTLPISFAYHDKNVSATVTAQLPIEQKWTDRDKQPLTSQTSKELHIDDPAYSRDLETIEVGVRLGKLDLQTEVRGSVKLQELLIGAGFTYNAGTLSLSGQTWLLTGVRKHDVGFKLSLHVNLP